MIDLLSKEALLHLTVFETEKEIEPLKIGFKDRFSLSIYTIDPGCFAYWEHRSSKLNPEWDQNQRCSWDKGWELADIIINRNEKGAI